MGEANKIKIEKYPLDLDIMSLVTSKSAVAGESIKEVVCDICLQAQREQNQKLVKGMGIKRWRK